MRTYGHGITGPDVSGKAERKVEVEHCIVFVRGSEGELANCVIVGSLFGHSRVVGKFCGAAPCFAVHGSGGLCTCEAYASVKRFAIDGCNLFIKVKLYAKGYAVNNGNKGKSLRPFGVLLITNLCIAVFEPICIEGDFCLYIFFGKVESDGLVSSPTAECFLAD